MAKLPKFRRPHQGGQFNVGLVAAWGRYPVIVARALKRQGYSVFCLGVRHHADPVLQEICDDFCWVGWAKLGMAIRYFRRHQICDATMAGKFHKVLLYRPWTWLRHLPDWHFVRAFYPYFYSAKKDRKDDTLLSALVMAFGDAGIYFRPATDYAPELLVKDGQWTGPRLNSSQQKDVEFGWQLAKAMGQLDVGQTVCVKDRAVLAVEAIEGTDQCIRRAGELCPAGGFTVIKTAKPQQDMRFDVPTIGVQTLRTMAASGARLLAIEAERTVLLDEDQFLAFARRHNLTVIARRDGLSLKAAA